MSFIYRTGIAFLVCILSFLGSSAQFDALPETNAKWVVDEWIGPDLVDTYDYYLVSGGHDTIIQGDTFYRLNYPYEIGAIRDNENGQVYFRDFDIGQTFLLYDFDVLPGDTVFDVYQFLGAPRTFYVRTVDTIEYAGKMRKRIGIQDLPSEPIPFFYWIQGIGGTGGLLTTCCISVGTYYYLNCMSENDTIQYGVGEGSPGQCFLLSNIDESASVPEIPTITTTAPGIFNIENNGSLDIEIFSSTGALVLQTNGLGFDISQQPPGIYIVRLRGKEYVWSQKIVR